MTYPVNLGRDYEIVPLPAKLLDGLAHNFFGFASGVSLSAIEEVDTGIVSGFHAIECDLVSNVTSISDPAS